MKHSLDQSFFQTVIENFNIFLMRFKHHHPFSLKYLKRDSILINKKNQHIFYHYFHCPKCHQQLFLGETAIQLKDKN